MRDEQLFNKYNVLYNTLEQAGGGGEGFPRSFIESEGFLRHKARHGSNQHENIT